MRFSAMAFPSLKNVVWLKESKVTLALPLVGGAFFMTIECSQSVHSIVADDIHKIKPSHQHCCDNT